MQDNNVTENQESGTNWDEASLAQLLGFNDGNELKNPAEPVEQTASLSEVIETQNPIATDELFDDPELGKTQPTFYGNPLAKFGAVGLVMLVVFGAGATVLNSIMSGKPKIAPTIAYQETDKPQVEIADNTNPQETETGKLKAELALGSQVEKIKSLERSQSPKTSIIQRNNHELNKQNPPRIADTEVHPAQVYYVRRPLPQISRYDSPPVASVPRFQSNQSAAQRALKRGVNYSHQAMIDLIIQCPGISQNDIAAHFGYSVSWISTLMASDAFQSQLAKRREEIVDPMLIATAEERFKGIALRAADLIAERLAQLPDKIPDTFLLRSFELSSRAAGYGARQEPPAPPPAEIHVHLEKLGANLDSLLNRRRIAAQDAIDVEVDQAPSGA